MASQFASGNHEDKCAFCGSFVEAREFTSCPQCERAVRNYRSRV